MTTNDCRVMINRSMLAAGYTERDVHMFLAGGTMLGYLDDDRASWARSFLTKKFFENLEPFDPRINAAGIVYQIKKPEEKNGSKQKSFKLQDAAEDKPDGLKHPEKRH